MTSLPLTEQLKRLRLSGILETFDNRLVQARTHALSHAEWLGLLLQDEIQRRESHALAKRFKRAKFEQEKTFEGFELARYPLKTQHLVRDLMSGHYLREKQHILIVGPTGTGKTHLAQALGHHACRQGKSVRFMRAATLFRDMHASRADNSWERALKRYTAPELLIIDDFGLAALTFAQAEDLYEIIAERHSKASCIFTSNRKIQAWIDLFPDPAMGNAAVDRLAHHSHHLVLEGESYRRQMAPKPKDAKEAPASSASHDAEAPLKEPDGIDG
jgi:DNA replication protein DnaC